MMIRLLFVITLIAFNLFSKAQSIGSRILVMASDGNAYLGTIKAIQGDKYKIKYDKDLSEVWLTADQFLITKSPVDPKPTMKQIPKTVEQVPGNIKDTSNTHSIKQPIIKQIQKTVKQVPANTNNTNKTNTVQQPNLTTTPKYKVGDRIELYLDGTGIWHKGFIKEVNFSPNYSSYYLVQLDKGLDKYGGNNTYRVGSGEFNLMRAEGSTADTNPANCTFGPPPGNFTNRSPASQPLFKKIVYDKHMMLVNGTMSRPVRIGLTFLSIDLGKAYKNTVSIVPGRGAQRINDAAPVNAIIYPATVKYIICEDYNPGIQRRLIEGKHEFYISRFGEWTSSEDPFPKITILE